MPSELYPTRYKVKDADKAGVIDTGQAVELIDDSNALRLIIS